jgi:hypothetical protein
LSIRETKIFVNTYVDYQLTVQTRPGGAQIEGTFRFDEETKNVQMTGDINRINRYGTQSNCLDISITRSLVLDNTR